MIKVYVNIDPISNSVISIATQESYSGFEAYLEDPLMDLSKIKGYFLNKKEDDKYYIEFDESRYNQTINQEQKDAAIKEGKELFDVLKNKAILDLATDENAYIMRYLYDEWKTGVSYKKDDRLMYNDKFYKVLQDHTSQADWTPDTAVSLYVEVSDPSVAYPEFKQPTGAHDTYMKGDKVTFNNKHYESLVDNNAYSPEAYPPNWKEIN